MHDRASSSREAHLALIDLIRREIPGFRIAFKDDPRAWMPPHHRLIHALARRLVPDYDTRFTTVLGAVVYLPVGARQRYTRQPEQWYATMRHEFVHLLDARRHPVWMPLSYILLLPCGLSARAYWELRGYAQTMLVRHERGEPLDGHFFEHLVDVFSGRAYGFMLWPRPLARRVLEQLRERIARGELTSIRSDELGLWRDLLRPLLRRAER